LKIHADYLDAEFIERPNRFVMRLMLDGKVVNAYTPNTGSLAEYLVEGQKIYVVPQVNGKYRFKVVSTLYGDQFIFLDTIAVNRIVQGLLEKKKIPGLENFDSIRREVSFKNSRFDFLLKKDDGAERIVEVKSCTLSFGGTAMFPDAPTERGQRHLRELETLARKGNFCSNLYLISDFRTERFIPNFHTDPEYGEIFAGTENVSILPLKVKFTDPVTLDPGSVTPLSVGYKELKENNLDGGAYLLVMENPESFSMELGSLGNTIFEKGYYTYTGSAMKGLEARIARHYRKSKKQHWHIDYIVPGKMMILKSLPIRRKDNVEEDLAGDLLNIGDGCIQGFGATDSRQPSHLTYFKTNPLRNPSFWPVLLKYRMLITG